MSSHSANTLLALAAGAAMLAFGGTPARAAGAVTVENSLRACVAIQPGTRTVEHGVLLQGVALDVRKPIGECGCKSAIASYTSRVVLDNDSRVLLLAGRLNAGKSGQRTLPLASDATLAGDRPIALSFECAPPE
ncbi:DUF2195 family protein [Bordetella genomosp. 11]|nr:DUF2195 family protein [Bordetella genomosp. 11]